MWIASGIELLFTCLFWWGCAASPPADLVVLVNEQYVKYTDIVHPPSVQQPIPSLLQNLRDAKDTPIPRLSWSYTAGAYNLAPKVFGSLVLGGYDSTRFEQNDLIFPFGADISLDFQVAIQRITANNSNDALLNTPIVSYIDTLVPDIWLLVEICTAFLRAFQLSYDNTTDAYFVNSSQHALNLASNPVVSFQIGPETTGKSVTINMATRNGEANSIIKDGGFRFLCDARLRTHNSSWDAHFCRVHTYRQTTNDTRLAFFKHATRLRQLRRISSQYFHQDPAAAVALVQVPLQASQ